ncbi:hypothetical protein H7H82_23220 [Mycobacterium heidelbergense]|uniref:Uncharacterized protein n=1 Tax=Mycobacterium heidelbergense TaxID=53376 RepID=A0A1X0DDY8_MYCHE|nr:hypothetical protein [Mycobacterium heidelbergense]MCV7053467.1 hypothetical protein [Mycobacterium heidelbergense]ORA70557.1 hypothetical protein BST25_18870 [Mycobacterium heidelbergense]BBZ50479.1 hypothetical protein MHEI_21960 [Mycobacterium heidelbergense]
MHKLARLGIYAATLTMAMSPATAREIAAAEGGTTVVLDGDLRRCDFSLVTIAAMVPRPPLGTGSALIHASGSRAVAEVHVAIPNQPGTHYDVGLIQEPRPSSATCGPGDPGTAFTGMDTDAAGNGTVTIQDTIRSGTTGVWVFVERPSPISQNPAEFYTSEFVAPV